MGKDKRSVLHRLIIDEVSNGYILTSSFPGDNTADRTSSVVEEKYHYDELQEQKNARDLLNSIVNALGIYFSKHGARVHIVIKDENEKEIE